MAEDSHTQDLIQRTGKRRKKLLLFVVPIFVLLVLAFGFTYFRLKHTTPLDRYAKQLAFSIYYPAKLPEGYGIDSKNIRMTGDLIVYRLAGADNKPALVLTEQSMPANFDANQQVGKNATAVAFDTGTLYEINAGKQGKYILTAGSTLIFINATQKVESGTINTIVSSMRQIKR